MLHQEINLYNAFKEPTVIQDWLSIDKFIFYNSLLFTLFILIYLVSIWANHRLENQVIEAHKDIAKLQTNYYIMREKFPPIFFTQDVKQSVKQIQAEIIEQENTLNSLSTPNLFSKQLISLSQSIVPYVWLKE